MSVEHIGKLYKKVHEVLEQIKGQLIQIIMKRTFYQLLIFGLVLFSSCTMNNSKQKLSNQNDKNDSIEITKHESQESIEESRMILAKEWTDLMFEYIEKTEKTEITRAQFENLAKPLKLKQDSLKEILTPSQNTELEEYFQKKGSEMVDRLMEYKNY